MDSTKRPAAPRLADPLLDVAEHLGQAEQPVMAPPPIAPLAVALHYNVIAGYLSAHDRASLMQTQRAANTIVSQVPFSISNPPMAVKPDRGDHAGSGPARSPGLLHDGVSYQAVAHLLSSQDRGRLMQTERRAYVQIRVAFGFSRGLRLRARHFDATPWVCPGGHAWHVGRGRAVAVSRHYRAAAGATHVQQRPRRTVGARVLY